MALYPRKRVLGDLIQGEDGTTIGYGREVVSVTGTAGLEIQIGTLLQQDPTTGAVTIPSTTASITNPVIYIGDDPYINKHSDWFANTTVFTSDNLTQKVVVLYRGYAEVGINKAALIYPSDVTSTTQTAVEKALDGKGFKLIRGVVFPAGV